MAAKISVDKLLSLGTKAAKQQDWIAAVSACRQVKERFPNNKRAQKLFAELRNAAIAPCLNAANEARAKEDWAKVISFMEAAWYLGPDMPEIGMRYAEFLVDSGDPAQALPVVDSILETNPENVVMLTLKGHALHGVDRPEEARRVLKQALANKPDHVRALLTLGIIERSGGDLEAAQKHFDAGLAHDPLNVDLLINIAQMADSLEADDPLLQQMRDCLATLDGRSAAIMNFALFEALHKAKQHSLAFDHLAMGNAQMAQRRPFDFKAEAIVGAFSKALLPDPLPAMSSGDETRFVFVTGLPRTGTTLVERILARSEGVQAAGELMVVLRAVYPMLENVRERSDRRLTSKDIANLRERLLEGFARYSDGSPVLVDKMPLNFRWIGYICAALPEARIVHMNRDPRAVAWSLYKHVFHGQGHDFMYTPADIARFMVFHQDLMKHWRKICGDRLFDLNYTDLINDQQGTTQALANAVGLKWTEDWLSPEKAETHVRTASVVQVTKPIYAGSDDGWKRYESQLAPMMSALTSAKLIS